MEREPILAVGLALIFSLIIGFYLYEHWEDIFGPKAEEFLDFSSTTDTPRYQNNESLYNITCVLHAKRTMYNVDLNIINRSNSVKKIVFIDKNLPNKGTLSNGTNIYPQLAAEVEGYGWIGILVTFMDIDSHQKSLEETIHIPAGSGTKAQPGFEILFTIFGILASSYFLLERMKRK